VEQASDGRFPRAVVAGVAWSFLAGFPETAALNMLLAAAWGGLRLVQSPARGRYALNCCAAVAAGLLIAAPAIWPFLEALPREFVGEHATGPGAMVAANAGQALFPALLGNPLAATNVGAAAAAWRRAGGYLPLAVAAVAMAGLARPGKDRALRWLLAWFVVVTGARAAGLAPAMWLFGLLPLLRQAAVHMYIWPAWSMVAAVLAAFATVAPQKSSSFLKKRTKKLLFVARSSPATELAPLPPETSKSFLVLFFKKELLSCFAVAAVALWLASPAIAALMAAPPPFYHPLRDVALGLLAAAAVLGLLAMPTARWRRIGVAAVLCGQAAALAAFWQLAGPHGRVPDQDALRYLQSHAALGRVVSFGPLAPNYGAMFGIAEVGYNALPVPKVWVDAVRARLPVLGNGVALAEGDLPTPDALPARVAAYESFGAAYALVWPGEDLGAGVPATTLVYRGEAMDIWRLPSPAAYVEAPSCSIQAMSRTEFTADCTASSRLLRRELADPGWRAAVNGVRTTLGAAGIFQSVALPAGKSAIRFAYAPPYMMAAWASCAIGLVLLLLGVPLLAKPRRLDDDGPAKELP
jgi:hypothetical protein